MSWSRSASGSAASVIEAAERWPGELAAADGEVAVALGEYTQASRVLEAVKAFADRVPAGYQVTISAGGHSRGVEVGSADSFYANLGAYLPVPVAAGARGS